MLLIMGIIRSHLTIERIGMLLTLSMYVDKASKKVFALIGYKYWVELYMDFKAKITEHIKSPPGIHCIAYLLSSFKSFPKCPLLVL